MTTVTRTVLAMLVLTVVAAAAGGYVGVLCGLKHTRSTADLDKLLHHELKLSSAQRQQVAAMEESFARRRKGLEGEMRAANRELAGAILSEHRYGPRAEQAIDHFHAAMKTLQQETVMHVMAMRSVLTAEQAQEFDQTVSKALNSE